MSKTYCGVRDCGLIVDDPESDMRVLQCERCAAKDNPSIPEPTLFEVIDVRGIPFILYKNATLINLAEMSEIMLSGTILQLNCASRKVDYHLTFNTDDGAKDAFAKLTGKTDQPPLSNQLKANKVKNDRQRNQGAENI